MSQLPTRSLRLRSYATTDLDRLTGEKGEIFYDSQTRTLKIYNGPGVAASTVNISAAPTPPAQLVNGQQTATLGTTGNLTLVGDLVLAVNKDVKNSLGQGIFALLGNYVTGASLGSTLNSYVLQNTGVTGNIFTNLIDSADSSAITVTPAVIFSSDITVENDLVAKNIVNGGQRWQFGTDGALTIPGDIRSEGDINIEINLTDSTLRRWQFGEDGNLTLPPGGTILNSSGQPYVNGVTSISSSVSTGIYTDASGDYQYGTLDYSYAVNGNAGQFSIEYSRPLVGGNVDINVGNTIVNGDLTLSGDIKSNGNINIDINLSDSTLRRWQFGEDGNLTFPDGTNQSSAGVALPVCVINSSTTGSNIGEVSVNFTVTNPSGAAITAIGIYVPSVNTSNAAQDVGNTNTGTQAKTLTALTGNTRYWAQVYAVTANGTAYSAPNYLSVTSICLLAGTMIALADGTYKAIEDITYTDRMLSWDFDRGCYAETTALWIKQAETGSQYNLLTFSDGTTLRTFDQHRIFNKQAGAFTYPMTAATPIGTITVNEHGDEITLIGKQVVVDTIEYYNVITDHHMNLFSDTILTSCRFNNIYPILDMKFVKDSRMLRTRDEFENIPDRFFYGLRLAEQTYELDMIEWYVTRLLSVEQSFELAAV